MNVRLSSESVRMRASSEEARTLERERRLVQEIPFVEGSFLIELTLDEDQECPAKFSFFERAIRVSLREEDFIHLLAEKPARESRIRTLINSSGDVPIEFAFEIDLFSRKEKENR